MRPYEQDTLNWVNTVLVQYGISDPLTELPPDVDLESKNALLHMSFICPIARAFGRPVGAVGVYLGRGSSPQFVQFPWYVRAFIIEHDKRARQQLNSLAS